MRASAARLAQAPEALAVVSGILLALSFPKFGTGIVAWPALAPLLVALGRGPDGRTAVRLGFLTGAVSSLVLVYWTSITVIQFGGLPTGVGIAAMVLLCLALAGFPSVFAWLLAAWARAFGPAAVLAAPLAWVAVELVRARTALHFPWCLLGYSQSTNLHVIQIARYGAVYAVSALVCGVSAVAAYVALEPRAARRRRAVLAAVAAVALVYGHGAWRLGQPENVVGQVRVGLVQASVLQGDKWDPDKAWDNIDRHVALTRQAAAQGARLVVWPESAVPFYFDSSPPVAVQLRELVRTQRVALLFGNDDREAGAERRVWVGAKMLDPAGRLVYRYHKVRLVPFGEYVPFQSLFTVGGRVAAKLVKQVSDFTPGDGFPVGEVDGHRLGVFICYEAIFPDVVRQFAAGGAELLVNVTNDGWYGRTSAPHQHLAMAALRAVENGKYLVRAANTGITAVVDTHGRIVARTELFDQTALVRDVPWVAGTTFYARHGDLFAWACLAATAALAAAAWKGSRSRVRAQ